MEYQLGIRFYI